MNESPNLSVTVFSFVNRLIIVPIYRVVVGLNGFLNVKHIEEYLTHGGPSKKS